MFPCGIGPNVNVIAKMEFEFAYSNVAVQQVSHNDMHLELVWTRNSHNYYTYGIVFRFL